MEFYRQEYWSELPFPSLGDLSISGIKPRSPALQADPLPSGPPGCVFISQCILVIFPNKYIEIYPFSFKSCILFWGYTTFINLLLYSWTFVLLPVFNIKKWNYELCCVGPPKRDRSWWRVMKKHDPLEKGTANHFSIFALKTLWWIWKGKKIGHWKKWTPQVSRWPICYWRIVEK